MIYTRNTGRLRVVTGGGDLAAEIAADMRRDGFTVVELGCGEAPSPLLRSIMRSGRPVLEGRAEDVEETRP